MKWWQGLKNFGKSWIFHMMILFVQQKNVIKIVVAKIFEQLLEQGDIYLG